MCQTKGEVIKVSQPGRGSPKPNFFDTNLIKRMKRFIADSYIWLPPWAKGNPTPRLVLSKHRSVWAIFCSQLLQHKCRMAWLRLMQWVNQGILANGVWLMGSWLLLPCCADSMHAHLIPELWKNGLDRPVGASVHRKMSKLGVGLTDRLLSLQSSHDYSPNPSSAQLSRAFLAKGIS